MTADSAGVPWSGRELTPQPFAGDSGEPDPHLADALAAYAAGRARLADVVAACAAARLLVPVVAVLGEEHPVPTHIRGDLGADMAIVTLTGADGSRALPAFTGVEALTRWDGTARPVPVESARAALAAVAEGCDLLVLDAAGPVTVGVPRPAVWALGQGRPWTPPAEDGVVHAAASSAVHGLDQVAGLRTEPLGDAGVRLVLGVRPGLSRQELGEVVAAVRAGLAAQAELAERVDAVEVTVLPA